MNRSSQVEQRERGRRRECEEHWLGDTGGLGKPVRIEAGSMGQTQIWMGQRQRLLNFILGAKFNHQKVLSRQET